MRKDPMIERLEEIYEETFGHPFEEERDDYAERIAVVALAVSISALIVSILTMLAVIAKLKLLC